MSAGPSPTLYDAPFVVGVTAYFLTLSLTLAAPLHSAVEVGSVRLSILLARSSPDHIDALRQLVGERGYGRHGTSHAVISPFRESSTAASLFLFREGVAERGLITGRDCGFLFRPGD